MAVVSDGVVCCVLRALGRGMKPIFGNPIGRDLGSFARVGDDNGAKRDAAAPAPGAQDASWPFGCLTLTATLGSAE